jgi:hypothetical protein
MHSSLARSSPVVHSSTRRPERFWAERYQEDVVSLMPRFKPQELANVLWAMAVLNMKLPQVGEDLDALIGSVVKCFWCVCNHFKGYAVTGVGHGCAQHEAATVGGGGALAGLLEHVPLGCQLWQAGKSMDAFAVR